MNRYESSTPRAALGLAAVAMAVITMGVLVVLPAKFDSVGADPSTLAAAKGATKAPIEGVTSPKHIGAPETEIREAHATPVARLSGRKNSVGTVTN